MRITIIGCGIAGLSIAGLCIKNPIISEIVLADLDSKKLFFAKKLLRKITRKKTIRLIKITKSARPFHKCCKKSDFVINSSSSKNNYRIARECLKNGANYLDLVSEVIEYPGMKKSSLMRQLRKLDVAFKQKKLLAVTNSGLSPGISDIFAHLIFDRIDAKKITKVDILLADIIDSKTAVSSWSPETLMLEILSRPTIWKKNKIVGSDHRVMSHRFMNPIGIRRVYTLSGHPELITISESSKIPIHELSIHAAFETGGLNIEEIIFHSLRKMDGKLYKGNHIDLLNHFVAPPHLFERHYSMNNIKAEVGGVEVIVKYLDKNGIRKKYGIGANCTLNKVRKFLPFGSTASFGTAVLPAILVNLILRKIITASGVFSVSQLGNVDLLKGELEKFGIIPKRVKL